LTFQANADLYGPAAIALARLLVLGYGAIPLGRIEEGLRRLRACFPS
jgi:hypothetical protein